MTTPPLSARELEVLTLVAEGLSTADVSARLHISSSTVAGHMRRVRRVLGVTTRQRAVVVARERGRLLGPPAPPTAGPVVALIGELKRLLAGAGRAS